MGQLGFWVHVCLFLVRMVSGSPKRLKGMRADLGRSISFCLYLRDSTCIYLANFKIVQGPMPAVLPATQIWVWNHETFTDLAKLHEIQWIMSYYYSVRRLSELLQIYDVEDWVKLLRNRFAIIYL